MLSESKRIEGTLRSHIQMHTDIAFVYVGSRRQLLMDMFGRNRPFYGSSSFLTLKVIRKEDFVPCIVQKFSANGKTCGTGIVPVCELTDPAEIARNPWKIRYAEPDADGQSDAVDTPHSEAGQQGPEEKR
jgi:hypothetical protein